MKYNDVEIPKMKIRRRDKRIWFFSLGIFAMVFLFTFLTSYFRNNKMGVEAASLDNFDPGLIISDWQMGNYNSMTETEIQAFLTTKNSCKNDDYEYYLRLSANTNYKWHFENGHFVCLSEELFGDGEVIGEGETAAHIIWQTAQDYKINPQVLLVLLQKETGLITDPIPNDGDYRKATGYGCPDTAPCLAQYYGFKNQIRKAAALFRAVLDGGWTNYPLGENYVQYNPNASCGGSVVNIRSLATSALYRYTPYQPNEGALAAGYGTAYCGAYGNRNFYLYFEDWFGGITLEKADTRITEENELDSLTWEVLKAQIEEKDSKINLSEFDKKYSEEDELTRLDVITILWKIFGEKVESDDVFYDMKDYDLLSKVSVSWAYNNNITKYYNVAGEFAPTAVMTRREAMIFLWRYAGQPEADIEKAKAELRDLPTDELGQKAVAWAYENGITKYYHVVGEFAPSAITTRREAMIFFWRYAGQPEADIEKAKAELRDLPTDELGQKAVAWAYENGITKYYYAVGEFAPSAIATRREAMIFFWRFAGKVVDGEEVFEDMPEELADKVAVVWAYNNGITKFYRREGELAPNAIATRKEGSIFIGRAFPEN